MDPANVNSAKPVNDADHAGHQHKDPKSSEQKGHKTRIGVPGQEIGEMSGQELGSVPGEVFGGVSDQGFGDGM